MSLFSRRKLLLGMLAVPVAGCGFTPIHRSGGAANALRGNIYFNLIDSRQGFVLLERLEQRFGSAGTSARFKAKLDLIFEEEELVLTVATGLNRNTLKGYLKISVVDAQSGDEVFSDKLRDQLGYSSSEQTIVTAANKREAYDRLTLALADQAVVRLSSTAESWAA